MNKQSEWILLGSTMFLQNIVQTSVNSLRKQQEWEMVKMSTYKDAGVDVEAGYKAVKLMRKHVQKL